MGYTYIYKLPVGTKTVELVAANPMRTCVFVYNNSSVAVEILSAQNQVYGEGIPVAAGGTYKNDTSTAELFIVAASGEQDVRVEVDSE